MCIYSTFQSTQIQRPIATPWTGAAKNRWTIARFAPPCRRPRTAVSIPLSAPPPATVPLSAMRPPPNRVDQCGHRRPCRGERAQTNCAEHLENYERTNGLPHRPVSFNGPNQFWACIKSPPHLRMLIRRMAAGLILHRSL